MSEKARNDDIQSQYATSRNLALRGSFQAKYASVSWFDWLFDKMDLEEGANILDVGCGPGWFWRALEERLPNDLRVSLIDTSPGMIEEAKTNLLMVEQIDLVEAEVADAVALPYAAETFDVVLLLHVLYHVNDPQSALLEAKRVLRSDGRVFVSTNALNNMSELHALGAMAFGGLPVDPGAALFSLDDAERLVEEMFEKTERHNLTDLMTSIDTADAMAVLLSMPPGNTASNEQQNHLAELVRDESNWVGGRPQTTRRNGLIVGTKTP